MTTATKLRTEADLAIRAARLYAPEAAMLSSAELCLCDAEEAYRNGDHGHALARAVKSLAYSVGITSRTYQRFANL